MVAVLDPTLIGPVDITEGLSDDGTIVVNTSETPTQIRNMLNLKGRKIFTIDASKIALEELGRPMPNTPMIGALVKATGLLQLDNVIADIKGKFAGKFSQKIIDGNVNAIKRAYQEVKSE